MSTPLKRTTKSKFLSEDLEDFIDESKYLKEPPKSKKLPKRLQSECIDEDIPQTIRKLPISGKKKKVDVDEDTCRDVKGKLLETMEHQIKVRKQGNDHLLKSLSEVIAELKDDCIALKNNQQKLQQLATAVLKCIGQATTAQEQKLQALNDIHTAYKKQCEDMELAHRNEANKLADDLEEDIDKLRQKLISETKRSGWENLRKHIFQAMQNDF